MRRSRWPSSIPAGHPLVGALVSAAARRLGGRSFDETDPRDDELRRSAIKLRQLADRIDAAEAPAGAWWLEHDESGVRL